MKKSIVVPLGAVLIGIGTLAHAGQPTQGTDFQGTDMQGTDLQGTPGQGTDFQGSPNQGADFQGLEAQGNEEQGAQTQGREPEAVSHQLDTLTLEGEKLSDARVVEGELTAETSQQVTLPRE